MRQVAMSMHPRLLRMVGRKLYDSHPLVIIPRELIQNSRDACLRKGVVPDIRLQIQADDHEQKIVCWDNGCGMTEDQLVDDFLCLGGSNKIDDVTAVGGFGIAKAVIMSGDDWSIWSLDNEINLSDLLAGRDVRKVQRLDGTRVTVHLDENLGYAMYDMLKLIYFSDVFVNLTVTRKGKTILHDEHAGYPQDGKRVPVENQDKWKCWGAPSWRISYDGDYGETSYNFTDRNIFRLNGLAQFSLGYGATRQTNLVFDIDPGTLRPEDKDYPFPMSREALTNSADKEAIVRLIANHDTNSDTAKVVLAPVNEVPALVRPGYVIQGTRGSHYDRGEDGNMGNALPKQIMQDDGKSIIDGRADKPALIIVNYDKDRLNDELYSFHAKLLRVWEKILVFTAGSNESFGLGIDGSESTGAMRDHYNGRVFYYINPFQFEPTDTPLNTVYRLWVLACHECAHAAESNHNERFSRITADIMIETVPKIVDESPKMAKVLR